MITNQDDNTELLEYIMNMDSNVDDNQAKASPKRKALETKLKIQTQEEAFMPDVVRMDVEEDTEILKRDEKIL